MELRELPMLKYFYPGPHMLQFPALKKVHMDPCKWAILKCQGAEAYLEEQPLIPAGKVDLPMRSMEKLSFGMGDATVTWHLKSQKLELDHLQLSLQQSDSVLYQFLQMVPNNVEKLVVKSAYSLEEMFSADKPDADYAGVLSHLKGLRLYFLSSLESIGLEHSWLHPITENLQTLEVVWCTQLKNLAPCTVSFSNLTNLVVSKCDDLLYLFTSSTAKSLTRLERMEIRECGSMQEIVSKESDESHDSGNIIFEQLQDLYLEQLPMLRCFYSGNYTLCFPSLEEVSLIDCLFMKSLCPRIKINQDSNKLLSGDGLIKYSRWEGDIDTTIRKMNERKIAESAREVESLVLGSCRHFQEMWLGSVPVPDPCFSNLESLVVEGCEFLSGVLPSYLLRFLNKMQKLEVRNCNSVKTIFDVECITNDQKMIMGPALPFVHLSLETLVLEKLPNLESVWNEDPHGVLRVKLLEEVRVDTCKRLTSLFPTSLAKDLEKLETLEVKHCEGLVQIVAGIEAAPEGKNLEFTCPCLTSLKLLDLPKLKCFPLKIFTGQDPHIEDQISVEEVTPNLANLSLGEKEMKMIWHGQCQGNHSHTVKVLNLQGFNVESDELPYGFLQKVANIEKLVVSRSSFKEMFSSKIPNVDCTGFLSQLKGLKLDSLSELKSIGLEHSWVKESFLKNLETLEAKSCSRLKNLVSSPVCFSSLMHLTVSNCHGMIYLFTSSTAKSLAQLKQMEIAGCGSIQEIVSEEGDESHRDGIIFGQLEILNLRYLGNLKSFYKGSFTLSFPSLEELSVIACSRMDTFSAGTINANKLSTVKFKSYGEATTLEVDLNSTIRKAFKAQIAEVKSLSLKESPHFQKIWHGSVPVPDACFSNLESMVVERCEFLSEVLPANLLPFLNQMQKLEVRNCSSVKTIFDVKSIAKDQKVTMGLKKLVLEKLPNLECVWNEDPDGILSFQLLQEVRVDTCNRLTSLFPTSVAKDLKKLKNLEVKHCEGLVEIVAGIEAAPEGRNPEFTFSCLTSLTLLDLPKLKCFYCSLHCVQLKIFTGQDPHVEDQICVKEVTPNLANLSLGEKEMKMIRHGQCQGNPLHKIKVLDLQGFNVESDELSYGFLQKVNFNVEKLVVSDSSFEEMFSSERLDVGYTGFLSQLKGLKLDSLSELKSIGLEHSWVKESFLKSLETLEAERCFRLKNLVSSPVCFSSLMHLTVSGCYGMIYLFTSSTAKSLAQLKQMKISWCSSIQEIVSEEGDESHHDEIIFGQLRKLTLKYLPNLKCFYDGSVTLSFPSLEELSVIDCRRMDTFCAGTINAKRLPAVKFESYGEATTLEVDLNSTIRKALEAQIARKKKLTLEKSPYFQEIWHGSVPVPACFSHLESLIVEGCEFLSKVLPSNLLPFLNQMQNLEVRKCSSVKTIFDVECLAKDNPLPFSLKTLVLEKLPNLESVWNENPDGVLSVQLLQEVRVDKCKSLTSLFPTSVVKDLEKLETLEVKHREGLVEIVAGIEAAPEGTNLEFTFPCLTSLTLLDLPKLKCFYCSLHCVHLKLFTGQDPHTEDQICVKEVTPNLANLSLGEKEMKMIWHGQCPENHLHEVKVLDLQSFNVESDELPYGFLEKVPNIEDLVVSNSSFKEIFCSERPNVDYTGLLSQLKKLNLHSLPELISIGLEHSWVEESFLKILETLEAKSCSRLRNLVSSPVCFSNLMHMSVSNCEGMIHLFTSLTAKSLAQLKHMDISRCKSIQEIVSKEGDESHQDEIIFGQLQKLELQSLPNLKCFYNGSVTLSFPSLEELSVIWCSRMDTFCAGTINANRLSAVKFEYFEATTLEVDLNFTIRKAFEAQLAEFVKEVKDLKLVHKPEVHEIWRGSFPVPSLAFISLKTLIVERCEFLSNAIPSHILGLLCNLEELAVRQCDSVKAIFEVKDAGPAFFSSLPLKKLTFEQLPNLEHVWESDPQEVIGLQNLQEMYVHGCESLERLFPALVAESLVKLEKLEVQRCGRLAEIVAKDEVATEDAPKEFVLPCVTSIKLEVLPELKCFYPGPHKLECPMLKQVLLFHCDKLRTITCESQSYQEAQPENQGGVPLYLQALFLAEKVIPYLEFLALSKEEVMMIWHGQFHVNPLHKLQALQLQCFHDDSDTFPYGLLQKVPNIEKLAVSFSSFKEIFCSERPNMDCAEEILSHLKCLQLSSLSQLNSIGLEHSWMIPISENLEKLQMDQCHCLRNIVPCNVSFSGLIELNISQCGGLVYLFTTSTSRTLHQLKNMSVKNCESLEEIVSEEVEGSSKLAEEKIIFEKLKTLTLESLPRLGRFYNGTVALSFPSLDQLLLIDCRRMESFCAGFVSVNKWTEVKFEEDEDVDAVLVEVDLNYTIRKAFEMLF